MTSVAPGSRGTTADGASAASAMRPNPDELAAAVLTALHRVAKQSTLYEDDNETRIRQLNATREAIELYGTSTGRNFSVFWLQQSVFIGRRLLRAGRSVYASVLEMAEMLEPLGIAQIVIGYDVPVEELRQLQEVFCALQRHSQPRVEQLSFSRIRLRRSPDLDKRFVDERDLAPSELAARCYAKAVVVMRRFLEELQEGKGTVPIRVHRASQQLVDVGGAAGPELVSTAMVQHGRGDDASRAVNAAILAVAVGRQLGASPRVLARIATATLLADVGTIRVAGLDPTGETRGGRRLPRLAEEQHAEIPAATAAWMIMLGGVSDAAAIQTAVVYEALHVELGARLEPPYGGLRGPTVAGRIVAMARQFAELDGTTDVDPPHTTAEIMTMLEARATDPTDQQLFRTLASVLGIYPTGALVELSTGEVAQVTHTPASPSSFSRPVVRVIIDGAGNRLARPREVHLAAASPTDEAPSVARVLAMPDAGQVQAALEGYRASRERERVAAVHRAAPQPSEPPIEESQEGEPEPVRGEVADAPAEGQSEAAVAKWAGAATRGAQAPAPVSSVPPAAADGPSPTASAPPTNVGTTEPIDGGSLPPPGAPARASATVRSGVGRPVSLLPGFSSASAAAGSTRPVSGRPAGSPLSAAHVAGRPASIPPPATLPALGRDADVPVRVRALAPPVAPQDAQGKTIPPKASGRLEEAPLVELVAYLGAHRFTGSVDLVGLLGERFVLFFDRGRPAKAYSRTQVAPLDRVLSELKLVGAERLDRSLKAIGESGTLHGEHLVAEGAITRYQLLEALRAQLVHKARAMFLLPGGTRYAVYEAVNLLADYGGPEVTPVDFLQVVMAGVRARRARGKEIDKALGQFGGLALSVNPAVPTAALGLLEQEKKIEELLKSRPHTIAQLEAAEGLDEPTIRMTVYALYLAHALTATKPAGSAASIPPASGRTEAQDATAGAAAVPADHGTPSSRPAAGLGSSPPAPPDSTPDGGAAADPAEGTGEP